MRRQVDHHLARARAIGRRASTQARAVVWESAQAVERAVSTLYPHVTIDIVGDKDAHGANPVNLDHPFMYAVEEKPKAR